MNLSFLSGAVHGALKSTCRPLLGAALLSLAVLPVLVAAQPAPPPGGRPPGAPPEAVAACAGKAEGAQASFTNREGKTMTGTCQRMGTELVAMPAFDPNAPQRPAPAR